MACFDDFSKSRDIVKNLPIKLPSPNMVQKFYVVNCFFNSSLSHHNKLEKNWITVCFRCKCTKMSFTKEYSEYRRTFVSLRKGDYL